MTASTVWHLRCRSEVTISLRHRVLYSDRMNPFAPLMFVVSLGYVGLVFLRPNSVLYQYLEFRAACLWKERAAMFLRFSSVACLALSVLWMAGLIWK